METTQSQFLQSNDPLVSHGFYINAQVLSPDFIQIVNQVVYYTTGSLTTSYGNDNESRLNKIIQQNDVTEQQVIVLKKLLQQIVQIEATNNTSFNIDIDKTFDDEIVITKRGDTGLSLISVNSYGDIMAQYSGYTQKKKITFFDYEDFDPELTVFTFLSSL